MSSPISGCSRWICSTIDPIGSSTSGIQTSSEPVIAGRIGRFRAEGAPRDARRDDQHEDREQPSQGALGERLRNLNDTFDADDRAEPDQERGPPVDVAVSALPPGADQHRRQDREQRSRLRVHLGKAENEHERRHEENSAADAEEAGQDAAGEAEDDDENLAHTRRRIPTAVRRSENPSASVLPVNRCCSSTPSRTPPTAGRPISAAAPGFRSPCRPYAIAPAAAVREIAAREVPVAVRPERPTTT